MDSGPIALEVGLSIIWAVKIIMGLIESLVGLVGGNSIAFATTGTRSRVIVERI